MGTPCFWCRERNAEGFADFEMQAYVRRETTLGEVLKGAEPIVWQSSIVPIPICGMCEQAHKDATDIRDQWTWLVAVGGCLAILVLGLVLFGLLRIQFPGSFGIWWAIVIGWVVAGLKIGQSKALRRLQESGTARYREGQTFPAVVEMQSLGWKPGSPGTFDKRIAKYEYF
ncbi:MAG: hypothetical protein WAM92_20040 [Mycobacterium sp.]